MKVNNIAYIKRFEDSLKEYNEDNKTNYTFEDIQNLFTFNKSIKILNDDEIDRKCMCKHNIRILCEIENPETGDIMILGKDCIQTYMIKTFTKCKECKTKYKFNGKDRCKECRRKITIKCNKCNEKIKMRRYKTNNFINCDKCIEDIKNKCIKCNKKIDGTKYKYCYKCKIDNQKQIFKKRFI